MTRNRKPPSQTDRGLRQRYRERLATVSESQGLVPYDGKCTAMTTGKHGPKRKCSNWAIPGGHVCLSHGGSAPQVRSEARRRFLELTTPAIARLESLMAQDDHKPAALGAVATVLNRGLGKVGESPKGGSGAPVINIGVVLGGLPQADVKTITASVAPPVETDLVDSDE